MCRPRDGARETAGRAAMACGYYALRCCGLPSLPAAWAKPMSAMYISAPGKLEILVEEEVSQRGDGVTGEYVRELGRQNQDRLHLRNVWEVRGRSRSRQLMQRASADWVRACMHVFDVSCRCAGQAGGLADSICKAGRHSGEGRTEREARRTSEGWPRRGERSESSIVTPKHGFRPSPE